MPTALDYLALQRVADSSLKRAVTMSLRDGAQCFTHAWGLARAQGTVAARAEQGGLSWVWVRLLPHAAL